MIFAGTPAMTVFSGIEPLTTELAPTTTPLPIIVPGKTVTFSPNQTLWPITTAEDSNVRMSGGIFGELIGSECLKEP